MEVMGFVTKATHIAVYDAPVGTYEELSFRVHKFGERWLGVTTRAKAVLPYASCFRSVWQQRLQIRDATVSPVLPLSPPALVLLLIGLAGCSKDRGELALKEAASLIDLGACDSKEPQALAVLELEETTARMPSNPTYGENDCRENLPIGEPEGGETPLVDVSGPALAFITPRLPPMPIIPPIELIPNRDGEPTIHDMPPMDELPQQVVIPQEPSHPQLPTIAKPQPPIRETPPEEEPEQTSGELSPPQAVEITSRNPVPPPIDGAPPIDVIPNRDGVPIIDDMPPVDELPQQVVIPQEPSHPQLPTIAKPQPPIREMPPEEKPEQTSGEMSPPQVAEITSRNPAPPPIDGAPPRGNTPPAEGAWPKGLKPSENEPILLSDIRLSEDDDPAAAERAAAERAGDDRAGDDPAGDDPAGNDPAGNESDANPPPALPRQNQFPIVAPGNHNDATTPLVILGSNHFDQPTIGSAHGNIINLSTGGSVKNPQVATLGQGADHVIYGVGVGSLLNSWQPYDGAQKILNFDIGTDKLWFKQGRPSEGWVHDINSLLLRIHKGSISYVTADSGTDGNPDHDIITSVVVAGPVHRSVNLVFYQIELHFHQPDDQRAAFDIYSQKPEGYHRGTLATFIEIMGDGFGMINDWDDLGYNEGTLPTQSMPAIL